MRRKFEQYNDTVQRLYPELLTDKDDKIFDITLQVTDSCNLRCSYCYQICKKNHFMDFETAKNYIDMIAINPKENEYFNPKNVKGLIFDFIGGEPFLNIDLIDKVMDYTISKLIEMNSPLIYFTRFLICTNGTLYFDPKVQKFLDKYKQWLSVSISIDGNKELHDACRKFPDGSGSYDIVVKAIEDWREKTGEYPCSKVTLSPSNINYLFDAVKNLLDLGFTSILGNVVFEKGWNLDYAKIYYKELTKLGNYLLDNDLEEDVYISFFEYPDSKFFRPKDWSNEDELKNWCGGNGAMIALNYTGNLYPCLRYMEDALGDSVPPLIIGNVNKNEIATTEEQKQLTRKLKAIDSYTQSSDECRECPIAVGCAWCQAYNYQETGVLNKRVTYICPMHKARALANIEFWNKYYKKHNIDKEFPNNMKQEWIDELLN